MALRTRKSKPQRPHNIIMTTGFINRGFKDGTSEKLLSRGLVSGISSAVVDGKHRRMPYHDMMGSMRRIKTLGTPAVESGLGGLADHIRENGHRTGWNCRSLALAVLGLSTEHSFGEVDSSDHISFSPLRRLYHAPIGQVVRLTQAPNPDPEALGIDGPEHWVVRVNPSMTLGVQNAQGPVVYIHTDDLENIYRGWTMQAANRVDALAVA